MHGLGNDFMVVDCIRQKFFANKDLIKKLSDRHFGIGFDQLLLVEPPYNPDLDFHYRIFNADGSEVQMCGNGARCFVKFVRDHGLTNKTEVLVSTMSGILNLKVNKDESITVSMGKANFEPSSLPFIAENQSDFYDIKVDNEILKVGCVSLGNPHVVLNVDNINSAPVEKIGPLLESHQRFPEHVNVGFSQKIDENTIYLRVFERGCGETFACGSGACAAAVIGIKQGLLKSPVDVILKGGNLKIEIDKENFVKMTGIATTVYEGEIEV